MILVLLYIVAGACFVIRDARMVSQAVPNPDNFNSIVSTGLRFLLTWPWWGFKK